jgi:hypothetical protein
MFQKAVRMRLRWQSTRGPLDVEDLWLLTVEELDAIYKALNRQVRAREEESLLDTASDEDEVLDLQVAIVKHIVKVKLAEAMEREKEAVNAAHKQKLLGVLAQKQDAELLEKDVDELQALIDKL